jgi:hypothetical protein
LNTQLKLEPLADTDDLLSAQDPAMRRALLAFGISEYPWSAYQTPRAFTGAMQEAFGQHLSDILGNACRRDPGWPDDFDPKVDFAFWKDLPRADFLVEQSDGRLLPALDRFHLASADDPKRTDQLQNGVAHVAALCKSSEQMSALSQVANQDLWVSLERQQMMPDSPWFVENSGERGALIDCQKHVTYTVRSGPDQSVLVRCTYDFDQAVSLVSAESGEMIALNPQTSGARCTVELAIATDGTVSVHAPLAGFCQLNRMEEERP